MNATHRKTLAAVYAEPFISIAGMAAHRGVVSVAIGCRVVEGNGSRARFEKGGHIITFHRPHPAKEAKPYQVRGARHYLENLGVRP